MICETEDEIVSDESAMPDLGPPSCTDNPMITVYSKMTQLK